MFFIECRDYLVNKLTESGIKTQPFITKKKLLASYEAHAGAVLFTKETFDRISAKKNYTDQSGDRKQRLKVFSREVTFNVIIGDASAAVVETIFEAFMANLDRGFMLDGNYVYIEPGDAEWADDDDSILKSKMAVNVEIKFSGGIYKDKALGKIPGFSIAELSGSKE